MEAEIIAVFGTSIVTPLIAYLKTRSERIATAERRDTVTAIINKRLDDVEKKFDVIDDMKECINTINVSLARIETILQLWATNPPERKRHE